MDGHVAGRDQGARRVSAPGPRRDAEPVRRPHGTAAQRPGRDDEGTKRRRPRDGCAGGDPARVRRRNHRLQRAIPRRGTMILPTVSAPTKGAVNPQSIAAAGNAVSAWLDARFGPKWASLRALFGVLGGGTVTIDLEQ